MTHDVHHHSEGKKPAFLAPMIMGLAFWLFAFLFLSLCDPSHHSSSKGHGHEAVSGHETKTEVKEEGNKVKEEVKTATPTEEHH